MNIATSITVGTWTGYLNHGLALRELQCVLGIAAGQTSKELAREFGIEAESVKKRVLSASTKLGVLRRAQLVAVAISKGIITLAMSVTPDPQHDHDQDNHQGVLIA